MLFCSLLASRSHWDLGELQGKVSIKEPEIQQALAHM